MKRHRHTPEQIVRKLREGDRLLNEGKDLTEVLRHLEVSESSWNRWRAQYGGMKANQARRLKELEVENGRLKKLLAEAEFDKAMLKELAEGNFCPRSVADGPWSCSSIASGSPNAARARSPDSTAPRNVDRRGRGQPKRRRFDVGCARSPVRTLAGAGRRHTRCFAGRGAPSTANAREGSGVTRGCVGRHRASASGHGRRAAVRCCARSDRITCGRSTSSSTRPQTAGG